MTDRLPEPDNRPGHYYVSVRDGRRWSLLYGPFARHADALAAVVMVEQAAYKVDARSWWYAFGTARLAPEDGPGPAGALNSILPPIPADTPAEENDATPVNE